MANINNPAGRLLNILLEAKSIAAKDQKLSVQAVWAILFNVERNELSMILKKLSKVLELPDLIRMEVNSVKNIDPKISLKYFKRVEEILSSVTFNTNMNSFLNQIGDKELYSLEVCDDLLSKSRPEINIEEDKFNQIINSAKNLLNEIKDANINQELKDFLSSKLEDIIEAMMDYKIVGIETIRETITSIIGDATLKQEIMKRDKKTKYQKSFWEIVLRLSIIISLITNSTELGTYITPLLGESTPQEAVIIEEINVEKNLPKDDFNKSSFQNSDSTKVKGSNGEKKQ